MNVSWREKLLVSVGLKLILVNVVPDDLFGGTTNPQDVVDVVLEEGEIVVCLSIVSVFNIMIHTSCCSELW